MSRNRTLLLSLALCLFSSVSYASSMKFVGFSESEAVSVENDINWFLVNAPSDNVFYKMLRFELEQASNISMESIPQYLYNHFPLVIADSQRVMRCQLPPSQCNSENFSEWESIPRSDQVMVQGMLSLYTPYMDRNYETSILGFSENRLLSVSMPNQTMAVVNKKMLKSDSEENQESSDEEYRKWVVLSQWLGLSRLHQVFSSNGKAITECKTNDGDLYLCDPYVNGSLYIASLALIAGSEECDTCTDQEKVMLKILAFDHILRTGKGERSTKVVEYLKKELSGILNADNKNIQMLMDMYETRNESPKRGLVL